VALERTDSIVGILTKAAFKLLFPMVLIVRPSRR
jgi:hypothetical protein